MLSTQNTKIIVLFVLLVATFLFSMLPLFLSSTVKRRANMQTRRRFDALMSLLSCYAAGVFLATCLLDLFPDVQDKLASYMNNTNQLTAYPLAEFIMVCGLFIILIIEQIVLSCQPLGGLDLDDEDRQALLNDDNDESSDVPSRGNTGIQRGGNIAPSVTVRQRSTTREHGVDDMVEEDLGPCNEGDQDWSDGPLCELDEHHYTGAQSVDEQSAIYEDPNSHSATRSLLLLLALSLHSVFEGLAVGLQNSAGQVLQIFAALVLHKSILAFSLGLNMAQSRLSLASKIRSNVVFSITSPLGVAIGIGVTDVASEDSNPALLSNAVLQGLACGTFLYIVFFEVLPHEFNSGKLEPSRLLKLLCLILGYATVAGLLFLDPTTVQPICQQAAQTRG